MFRPFKGFWQHVEQGVLQELVLDHDGDNGEG